MKHRVAPMLRGLAPALACVLGALTFTPAAAATVDAVRQRGVLVCGVSQGLFGFSERKADDTWSGFDVDICRAIAAAVLGDSAKVTFVPLSASERFTALSEGKIDVLSRNSTWTLEREAGLGLLFAGVNFHDGQGFMVHRDLNVTSALELGGSKVCVQAGTTGQALVGDYFGANSMTVTVQRIFRCGQYTAGLRNARMQRHDHGQFWPVRGTPEACPAGRRRDPAGHYLQGAFGACYPR